VTTRPFKPPPIRQDPNALGPKTRQEAADNLADVLVAALLRIRSEEAAAEAA
jgi:hypothetical protein